MHSYEGPSGRSYHHESEGSPNDVVYVTLTVRGESSTITIPMRDVLWLAARHVRDRRITALENMPDEVVLGLPAD